MPKLRAVVRNAVKSGPVPKLRNWRDKPVEKLTRAERVMAFIEEYCVVAEGSLRGQPIRLLDFQEAFIYAIFDNPNGTRRAYLSVARKNGKTALIACILLAYLVGPEAVMNARINSGAMKREQAAQVFNYAAKMVQLSPELSALCQIVPSGKRLVGLRKNVEYSALSADGRSAHGLSPLLMILDEAGQVNGPRSDFVDAIETAQAAYEGEALFITISTQGPTDGQMLSIWLDDAASANDNTIVSHVYAADEDADLLDRKAWEAANPALGVFRSEGEIADSMAMAARVPTKENTYRNLYLNQRVNLVASFVNRKAWMGCKAQPEPLDGPVYCGLDLSATTDLTALAMICRNGDHYDAKAMFWMPGDMVEEATRRDRAPYDVWVKQGFIKTTPGPVVDLDFVAHHLGEILGELSVAQVAYDDWRMKPLMNALDRAGIELPLLNFRQGYKSMSPALDALEAAVLQGKLRHGGNPVLNMCAHNAVVLPDPAGNRKLDKSRATGRIDGMQALAMAFGAEADGMNDNLPVTPWDADPNFSLAAL